MLPKTIEEWKRLEEIPLGRYLVLNVGFMEALLGACRAANIVGLPSQNNSDETGLAVRLPNITVEENGIERVYRLPLDFGPIAKAFFNEAGEWYAKGMPLLPAYYTLGTRADGAYAIPDGAQGAPQNLSGRRMTETRRDTKHLVFCDEFGNTGPNLFDPKQPAFVYAFLSLNQDEIPEIAQEIRALYAQEGLNLTEVKSSRLWGSARGLRRYARIGKILAKRGGQICISLAEKRYQACAMIVETYLDPLYNEYAPLEMMKRCYRQKFADACYDCLNDKFINEFLGAVHADNPLLIANIGERISTRLRYHFEDAVSHAAERMETRADRVFRYCKRKDYLPPNIHIPASQQALFFPGLEKLDINLEAGGVTAVLVRDEDHLFGHLLDIVFSHGQQLDQIPEARAYFATRTLTHIIDSRQTSSTQEFGLQLADLAAGLVGRVTVAALRARSLAGAELEVFDAWRSLLWPRNDHYWMVSDAKLPRVIDALFE